MGFTVAEKLQIAMLCDLAKPAKNRELDFDFIWSAVTNDDAWAISRRYSGLNLNVSTPPEVRAVQDILDMWDRLESSYEKLSEADKDRVEAGSYKSGAPRFIGFDGNNEGDRMHIAHLLIQDLGLWARFKDRALDAHMRTAGVDDRMLMVWRPLWTEKIHQGAYNSVGYDLSADEIASVMRERIHPENRQMQPDGGWIFDPEKIARR